MRCPNDGLDPLPRPEREHLHPGLGLVPAYRTDERVIRLRRSSPEPGPGETLVAHDRARTGRRRLDVEQVQGLLALVQLLGTGQAERAHRPVTGGDEYGLGAPVEGVVRLVHAVPGDLARSGPGDRGTRSAAAHGGVIHQPQVLPPGRGLAGQPHRGGEQGRARARTWRLYSDWSGRDPVPLEGGDPRHYRPSSFLGRLLWSFRTPVCASPPPAEQADVQRTGPGPPCPGGIVVDARMPA